MPSRSDPPAKLTRCTGNADGPAFTRRLQLGNEATRALFEHLMLVADRLGRRDDDQGRVRLERAHRADALEAKPARHLQIHQDEVVAPRVAALVNQLAEGSRLTKGHPFLEGLQQEPQSATEQ